MASLVSWRLISFLRQLRERRCLPRIQAPYRPFEHPCTRRYGHPWPHAALLHHAGRAGPKRESIRWPDIRASMHIKKNGALAGPVSYIKFIVVKSLSA
jgi:hypothetical protein